MENHAQSSQPSLDETPLDETPAWLGVDTGGTFTDFVLLQHGRITIHKVLSTPQHPEQAILQGIHDLGVAETPLHLIHGSTVATNAVLEGKGVDVAYITNRGHADTLSLARQNRDKLYEFEPQPSQPPVPADMCLETGGRLSADGSIIEILSDQDIEQLREQVAALAPSAVAINLLFSFLNPELEQRIAAAMPNSAFISCSSTLLPEYREYERGIATWLNAYVGPRMQHYLQRLQELLPQARITVMQSSGERIDAHRAAGQAVRLLLSGPAGGLVGGRFVGDYAGEQRLLSFDMGGTSTDVALIDGEPRLTTEGLIGGYPIAVPMVDMHTIGAGGGSIASLDPGGVLQVGPASAGASPGPACYGRGAKEATVTDAHAVLGHLPPGRFLGGHMDLDLEAAEQALTGLGTQLGCSAQQAAAGVLRLANEHMARALRVISIERGLDPSEFCLLCFGGAGGLHVCALAEELGITRALVPIHSGVLSALGMLSAPRGRQLSHTLASSLCAISSEAVEAELADLEQEGRQALRAEGLTDTQISARHQVELRYKGQAYTLNIPWRGDRELCAADFHQAHAQRYGHHLAEELELVNARVAVHGPQAPLELPEPGPGCGHPEAEINIHDSGAAPGTSRATPIWRRDDLPTEQAIDGPALVVDPVSTTLIAETWQATKDRVGNLLLNRQLT